MTTMTDKQPCAESSVSELRAALRDFAPGHYPAALVKHLLDALDAQDTADKDTWTVRGIWDSDEAVLIGAIPGRHQVHGEPPGDRIRDELFEANAAFYGFDTSSFYEQGVWAEVVTAPDGDAAQDIAVETMMRAQHGDNWAGECAPGNEACAGGTCTHPADADGNALEDQA